VKAQGYRHPPCEEVPDAGTAARRLLELTDGSGEQPLLSAVLDALVEPELIELACHIRSADPREHFEHTRWWTGGPILGVRWTKNQRTYLQADRRCTFLLLLDSAPSDSD